MFGEVITAMVTPLKRSGAVDYDRAGKLARYLLKQGSDGILVSGTTGEAPTLSDEEKEELFSVVKKVAGQAPVMAGVGTNSTEHTLHLVERAESAKVDGLLVVTPYYNKPPQSALAKHFKTVAKSTRLPIMLYDIPSRTATELSLELLLELKEVNNIVALKDAAGKLSKASKLQAAGGKKLILYSGNDGDTLPLLSLGAAGVVSVASHLAGKKIKRMVGAFKKGKVKQARQYHFSLLPLFTALFVTTNPIPLKYALSLRGLCEETVRPPLSPLPATLKRAVRQAIER